MRVFCDSIIVVGFLSTQFLEVEVAWTVVLDGRVFADLLEVVVLSELDSAP